MKEQFVSYDIALKLKELGFDEKCFGYYRPMKEWMMEGTKFNPERHFHGPNWANSDNTMYFMYVQNSFGDRDSIIKNSQFTKATENLAVPLWQQVIDWFREKHNIQVLQICPIPPEAIKAAKGNLDNKKGYGFFLYNVNWNPRVPNLDVWEESFYKGREQVILKALELIK